MHADQKRFWRGDQQLKQSIRLVSLVSEAGFMVCVWYMLERRVSGWAEICEVTSAPRASTGALRTLKPTAPGRLPCSLSYLNWRP